jgi:predicted RNA-binding protein with TRAM domain
MDRDRGFGGRRSFAPVNVGDVVDLKIEAVGEKGDGIAKIKGFVIFIPGVKEGDEVKVKITKVLQKVGFGEVVGEGEATTDTEDTGDAEESADDAGEAEDDEEAAPADEGSEEEPKDSENF